jgi:hypothetical protein
MYTNQHNQMPAPAAPQPSSRSSREKNHFSHFDHSTHFPVLKNPSKTTEKSLQPLFLPLKNSASSRPVLRSLCALGVEKHRLLPSSAYSVYSAVKNRPNQTRHENEPKTNQNRITLGNQRSKVNQKRIKNESNPNRFRTIGLKSRLNPCKLATAFQKSNYLARTAPLLTIYCGVLTQ